MSSSDSADEIAGVDAAIPVSQPRGTRDRQQRNRLLRLTKALILVPTHWHERHTVQTSLISQNRGVTRSVTNFIPTWSAGTK